MQTIKINGKKVTFQLKTVGGNLFLEATHIDGEEHYAGNLLVIEGDGRYSRCTGVEERFGFKCNDAGQIKRNKDGDY